MEGFEGIQQGPRWARPDFAHERGEIERVTREFLKQEPNEQNVSAITKLFESAPIVELSDTDWKTLQNTDSFHNVSVGNIEEAAKITEGYNKSLDPENKRDFQDLLKKMQSGSEVDAPAIVRKGGVMHLVSGNTRLMIARALSYRPRVVVADIPRATLREAAHDDSEFLFNTQYEAMRPVSDASGSGKTHEERLAKHAATFDPALVQVIQHQGQDVGRLRVVRSAESIYVGGIQLLPEFQGMGIGTDVFNDLIAESDTTGLPITLEVHDVNQKAIDFYEKLGFVKGGKVNDQTVMTYQPARGSNRAVTA